MIIWAPTVLSVLYACVLYFCIWICSAQLGMFHMEKCSRNTLIIFFLDRFYPVFDKLENNFFRNTPQ